MRIWVIVGTVVLVGLQGCGGGGGNKKGTTTNAPGAGVVTGPTVVNSVPTDNAFGVPINTPITVQFSEALDATSLNASTVKLLVAPESMADQQHSEDADMDPMSQVTGNAVYNASAQQLTVTPDTHLMHDTAFHLVLSGLRSASGAPMASTTIRFRTLTNPRIKSVSYDTTTDQITSTRVFSHDQQGNITRVDEYTGTETTGTLDSYTLMGAQAILPGPPPVTVRAIDFSGATSQITGYSARITQNGAELARASYRDPGADGLWNQSDDLISSFSEARVSHGTMHWITNRYRASTPSPWSQRTTAFTLSSIQLRELDSSMRTRRDVNYSSLGANGQVDTDVSGELTVIDDVVASYRLTTRNAQGLRISRKSFGRGGRGSTPGTPPNAGPNGRLFDFDDIPVEMDYATYNTMGHRTMDVEYDGPGPDNNWDTVNDNTVAEYDLYTYAPGTDNLIERRTYVDGGNNVMENGAGDDKLRRVETYDPTL